MEYLHQPQKFLPAPFLSIPSPIHSPWQPWIGCRCSLQNRTYVGLPSIWSFWLQLHLLTLMPLRFVHVVASVLFVPFIANQYFFAWMYLSLFIYSPLDEHLNCFQLSAILNRASINMSVNVIFSGMMCFNFSWLNIIRKHQIARIMVGKHMFNFVTNCQSVF